MKAFVIDEKLANAILQYLGRQPYLEVVNLVAGLVVLKEAPPEAAEPKE